MLVIKYRMIFDWGFIETLDLEEAKEHGNYVIIEETIHVFQEDIN